MISNSTLSWTCRATSHPEQFIYEIAWFGDSISQALKPHLVVLTSLNALILTCKSWPANNARDWDVHDSIEGCDIPLIKLSMWFFPCWCFLRLAFNKYDFHASCIRFWGNMRNLYRSPDFAYFGVRSLRKPDLNAAIQSVQLSTISLKSIEKHWEKLFID